MRKLVTYPHIVARAGVCGGRPCVAGHRLRVSDVVVWHDRQGFAAEEIARRYGLKLAEVHAALAYYYDHVDEIEADLAAGAGFERRMRARSTSLVKRAAQG